MVRGASCRGLQRPGSALARMSASAVSVLDICARSEGPVSALHVVVMPRFVPLNHWFLLTSRPPPETQGSEGAGGGPDAIPSRRCAHIDLARRQRLSADRYTYLMIYPFSGPDCRNNVIAGCSARSVCAGEGYSHHEYSPSRFVADVAKVYMRLVVPGVNEAFAKVNILALTSLQERFAWACHIRLKDARTGWQVGRQCALIREWVRRRFLGKFAASRTSFARTFCPAISRALQSCCAGMLGLRKWSHGMRAWASKGRTALG